MNFSQNFDLLDKEINEIKKINSEYKSNKNSIKKKIIKEQYLSNSIQVNTEEISNKINELKYSKERNQNQIEEDSERKIEKTAGNVEIKERMQKDFKQFFDDENTSYKGIKGNNIRNSTKKNPDNEKNEEIKFGNNNNQSLNYKIKEIENEEELDLIDQKLSQQEKKKIFKDEFYKSNSFDKNKESKPYKNFGNSTSNINMKNKFQQGNNYDKNLKEDRRAYDNMLKFSKLKDDNLLNEEERSNKKINHLLDNLYNFNSEFSHIRPLETKEIHEQKIDTEDSRDLDEKDPKVRNAVENIRNILQTKKIREKGALIPKEEKALNLSKEKSEKKDNKEFQEELYFKKIQSKLDESKQKIVEEIFKQNEVIEGISNIITHINTLKGEEMEKLMNILLKINYLNFEKWVKILEEYLLHLSMYSDTSYHLYTSKEISQIIIHLKCLEEALLLNKDHFSISKETNMTGKIKKEDILNLIKKAFEKSSECFLKDLEFKQVEFFTINTYMVAMAKYKLLEEKISKKIENYLLPKIDGLHDSDLCVLLFNVFKNKVFSEKFICKIEKKIENLLSDYLAEKKPTDTFLVTLISKSILSGMRNNHTLLLLVEDVYLKNKDSYAVHQKIAIAYALVSRDSASLKFLKEINEFLTKYQNRANLTELLCYQIVTILTIKSEFSETALVEYLNLYKKFIERNQVKPKQLKFLSNEIKNRLKICQSKVQKDGFVDIKKFLEDYNREILSKVNFYKFKK